LKLTTLIGVVTCPGIFPMVFTVLWRRQSKAAAILSPILGLATGLAVWLGTASHFGGEVSVASTGQVLPCMYGTVASCFSPIPYSILITLLRPQNYDWADFRKEKLSLEKLDSDLTAAPSDGAPGNSESSSIEIGGLHSAALESKELKRWGRIAAFWSIATFLGHWVIWPLPMYGSHYVFEKKVRALIFISYHFPAVKFSYVQIESNYHLGSSSLPGSSLLSFGSGAQCWSQSSTRCSTVESSRFVRSTKVLLEEPILSPMVPTSRLKARQNTFPLRHPQSQLAKALVDRRPRARLYN
jgi:hypothetical protein